MKINKEHPHQQHCPACNRYVKYSQSYPSYACSKCVAIATDEEGSTIAFNNVNTDEHRIQAILSESGRVLHTTTCFINGKKFEAQESDAGDIVLLPAKENKPKRKRKSEAKNTGIPT